MEFSRQENWSGLPFSSPGIFPTQGLNLRLLNEQVDSLPLSHQGSTLKATIYKLAKEYISESNENSKEVALILESDLIEGFQYHY